MIHRRPRTAGPRLALATVVAVGLAMGTTGSPPADGASPAARSAHPAPPHHPAPSHFTRGRVTNPWFPLRPGTRYAYRGIEDTAHTRDVMIATYRTRRI